jgi:hypothetical protein
MGAWPKAVHTATGPVRPNRPNLANARKWIFGRRKSGTMLSVDERQFELGYTPIACGLMVSVAGCALVSILAALWWFFIR